MQSLIYKADSRGRANIEGSVFVDDIELENRDGEGVWDTRDRIQHLSYLCLDINTLF